MADTAEEMPETRVPVAVKVQAGFRDAQGDIVGGRIFAATTRDVSNTGMCLFVRGLSAELLEAIGSGELNVDVDFPMKGGAKRLAGRVTWAKPGPGGNPQNRYLGVVYRNHDADLAQRIVRRSEVLYARPRVIAAVGMAAVVLIISGLGIHHWVQSEQRAQVAQVSQQLKETIDKRHLAAVRLTEVRGELQQLQQDKESQGDVLQQKQNELKELQSDYRAMREQVGSLAVREADLAGSLPSKTNQAEYYFQRGQKFASENNLAAALLEFERTTQIEPGYAEAYLEAAVISDLFGRGRKALELYQKYLTLKPKAIDGFEIRQNIADLIKELGPLKEEPSP